MIEKEKRFIVRQRQISFQNLFEGTGFGKYHKSFPTSPHSFD